MKYLMVTGQSGAGKTACVRYLEDQGSFCMDNIPPVMLPKLMEAFQSTPIRQKTVAFGVDVRSGEFFDAQAVAQTLRDRYKETRREHPLSQEGLTLTEAISEERSRLQPLRETADYIIDTTGLNNRAIKRLLSKALGKMEETEPPLRAEVMSFGFKRGLPRQADLVMDVRFLPNPFYIETLCRHSGLDEDVRAFVMEHPTTVEFMQRYEEILSFLIPHYREEGKRRLVIAVGCTGGAHRSVAIAEALGAFLRGQGLPVEVNHRDLLLEQARWTTPREEE